MNPSLLLLYFDQVPLSSPVVVGGGDRVRRAPPLLIPYHLPSARSVARSRALFERLQILREIQFFSLSKTDCNKFNIALA